MDESSSDVTSTRRGKARMVDVGGKEATRRAARAGARVWMAPATLRPAAGAGSAQGRRPGRGQSGRHHGGQAHLRAGPPLSSPVARPRWTSPSRWPRRRRASTSSASPAPRTAPAWRWRPSPARRGGHHHLRHVQGRRPGHGHRRCPPAGEDRAARRTTSAPAEPAPAAAPRGASRAPALARVPAGTVVAVNVSAAKGERKKPVPEVDPARGARHRGRCPCRPLAPAGEPARPGVHRQDDGRRVWTWARAISPRTSPPLGIDVAALPIRRRSELGEALVEVTQIGKECHSRCAIYDQAGDCVMPREGIFVRVLRGGPGRSRATPCGCGLGGPARERAGG